MPNIAISSLDAGVDADGAELAADRSGSTVKITPTQIVTSRLASTTPASVGTAAVGVGTTAARADHVHAHGNQAGGTLHADAIASGAAGFMSGADKAKLDGVATGATATPLTAATPQAVGTAAVGVSTDAARADHVHAHGDQLGGSLHADAVASGAAGFMSGADKAKLDGVATGATATPLSDTEPLSLGAASAGVGLEAAREDHVHAHGSQGGGSEHAAATTSVAGFLSSTDKTKLDALRPLTFPATTADTAITLDADDNHAVIRTTAGTTITVTVPTLAQGTRVLIVQEGAGQVQLSASGVTLQFPATFLARCAEQDSMIELLYLTATLVQVVGDMELAP